MSAQHIGAITLLVKEYDEAIAFYRDKLGFSVLEDTVLNAEKRWVRVAPSGATESCLLLAKANSPAQARDIGKQAGGRVFLFLHTDDFQQDYQRMKEHGVVFRETPRQESYGKVAVFEDLYGNAWDLIEKTY